MTKQSPLWISEGDPTGISYELLQKSYFKLNELSKHRVIILVKSQSSINCDGFEKLIPEKSIPKKGIFYINSEYTKQFKHLKFKLGNPNSNSGLCSYLSLEYSCKLIKEYGGNLITLPLSKEWIIKSGKKNF
ncbi:MAG: 4-hydroxythreonine-4-phosphate dehydrogenase, partial [Spirochaetia bacterium]|nr:4-hydroxythreonine-4-phosphate dehydrogenase [Spirochaetia bacterium]